MACTNELNIFRFPLCMSTALVAAVLSMLMSNKAGDAAKLICGAECVEVEHLIGLRRESYLGT